PVGRSPRSCAEPLIQEGALGIGDPAGPLRAQVVRDADGPRTGRDRTAVDQLVPDAEAARPDLLHPHLDAHLWTVRLIWTGPVVHRPQVVDLVPGDDDALLERGQALAPGTVEEEGDARLLVQGEDARVVDVPVH